MAYYTPRLWCSLLLCREGKIIFPLPFWLLGRDVPIIKDRLTREKQNRSLLTCIPSVYMGETKENWVAKMAEAIPLNTIFRWRLKKMLGVQGVSCRKLPEKAKETRVRLLCRFKFWSSALIRVSGVEVIPLFLVHWGRHWFKWRFPWQM